MPGQRWSLGWCVAIVTTGHRPGEGESEDMRGTGEVLGGMWGKSAISAGCHIMLEPRNEALRHKKLSVVQLLRVTQEIPF